MTDAVRMTVPGRPRCTSTCSAVAVGSSPAAATAADLARAVRSALDTTAPRQLPARPAWTWTPRPSVGRWARRHHRRGGVYKFFIARRDPVTMSGMPPSMGHGYRPQLPAHRQRPRGDQRHFVMTAAEVKTSSSTARRDRHRRHTQPRVRRTTTPDAMHFWAENDAVALARTLRAAVDAAVTPRGTDPPRTTGGGRGHAGVVR